MTTADPAAESYVTAAFPWVIVAEWSDSSCTVHGGFRTAEVAERFAERAWRDLAGCLSWSVVTISDPPVPR